MGIIFKPHVVNLLHTIDSKYNFEGWLKGLVRRINRDMEISSKAGEKIQQKLLAHTSALGITVMIIKSYR